MPTEKLKKCLIEGERNGERHQGLRKITPDPELAHAYVVKAKHNFEAITGFYHAGYSDWSASAAFYALYHGLLALLAKKGYESRNQSCTFALIEDGIVKGEIRFLTLSDLKEIFDKEVTRGLEHSDKILDLREMMQYSTKTALVESDFQVLRKRTKELFDKIRLEIEI